MKYLFIAFLFISSFTYSQGIEPSSFQPTPYLGGVLRGVTPFVDEFTGQTYYLYVHDSLDAAVPYVDTIFMTDYDLYYIKNGDTIFVGNVIDSSFIYNVVSDTFALDMDIDSTNELQELYHEDNILVLTGAGPDSQVDLTPYMDVDSIYMEDYDLWYTKSAETGTPRFVGNVTDSSYILSVVSDSSTVVENDYGTIITESPANTFGVAVDSSKFATVYDINGFVSGSGTDNYIPRFNGTTAIENSIMYDDGSNIGVGTTSPQSKLQVQGSGDQFLTTTSTSASKAGFFFNYNNIAYAGMKIYYNANDANVYFDNLYPYDGVNNFGDVIWRTTPVTIGSQVTAMTLKGNGKLGLGTTLPSQLLHVAGNSRLTGLFYDGNNEAGTAGQVLSSTGAITDWITPAADSTVVENDYGTIITESPANTYGVSVDSTKFFSTYAGSLKENALTFTSPLSRSVNTISIPAATSGISGHLTSADWTTFNNKLGGSGANTQAAYFTASNTLASNSSFTYASSQWNMIGRFDLRQTATNFSVCIGSGSGNVGTSTGGDNFWLGRDTGKNNTSGHSNFAGGVNALYSNLTGFNNTCIGLNSMFYNTSGTDNLALGTYSLSSNTDGFYNTALAPTALFNNTSGYANVAIGYNSMLSNQTGISNLAAGWRSLYSNVSGNYNVSLGDFSLYNTTGSYNVGLGYYAGGQNTTASNRLYIENSNSETPLIGGDFSGNKVGINTLISSIDQTLDVTGTVRITGSDGTATALMGRDGDGDISAVGLSGLSMVSGTLTNSNTGTVTSITVNAPLTTTQAPITTTATLGVDTTASTPSALVTQHDISSKVSGSGTDNYIPRFNGTTAIENSNMYDDGTNIGIGNTSPSRKLHVTGEARITDLTTDITPTVIIGADANGVLESLALSNLSIPGGTTLKGTGFRVNGTGSFNSGDLNLAYGMSGTYPTWAYSSGDFTFRLPTGSSGQVLKHDGTGWAAGTDASGGITTLNGLTGASQSFAVANSGTYFAWNSATTTHTLRLPAGTIGQVLKHDGTSWSAGTDNNTGMSSWLVSANGTAGTGTVSNGATVSLAGTAGLFATRSTTALTIGISDGGVTSAKILDGSVALADMASTTGPNVLGRVSGTSGTPTYNTIGTGIEYNSNQLTATTSHYGFLSDADGSVTSFGINTTPVKVNFDTPLTGLAGTMTVSSTNDNITVTAAGGYEINYGVCISGVASTRQISITIYKNGSSQAPTKKSFFVTSGDEDCASGSHIMVLNASDVIDLQIATSGAETVTLTGPQLSLKRLY